MTTRLPNKAKMLSRKQQRKIGNIKHDNGSSHLQGYITFPCSQISCMVVNTYHNEKGSIFRKRNYIFFVWHMKVIWTSILVFLRIQHLDHVLLHVELHTYFWPGELVF
jgi:hypothetical protein